MFTRKTQLILKDPKTSMTRVPLLASFATEESTVPMYCLQMHIFLMNVSPPSSCYFHGDWFHNSVLDQTTEQQFDTMKFQLFASAAFMLLSAIPGAMSAEVSSL